MTNANTEARPVGMLGYGTMGGDMSRAMMAAGIPVVAFDVTDEARARCTSDGATLASSPRDLGGRCDVVIVSLPDPWKVAEAVLEGPDNLLDGMAPGSTIIDTTTQSLSMVGRVAAGCAAKGVGHLDSPVSGRSPKMAMLVGGPEELIERHRPIMRAISTDQFLLGPVGAGTAVKLMNQYVTFATYVLICESAVMADKAGVSQRALVDALSRSSAASTILDTFKHAVVDQDLPYTPGSVSLIAKDIGLVADCFQTLGLPPSPALAWADEAWQRGAHDESLAKLPFPNLLRQVERDLG